MRAVVQRVQRAAVVVNDAERREIGAGLVVLIGISPDDHETDSDYLADKVAGLRIFGDQDGKMNLSVQDIESGACLVVSQFTLYGDCRRGKRPSFIGAAQPEIAIPLYEHFVAALKYRHRIAVQTGEFGAHMVVEIENDGPVTLLLDTDKLF